MRTVELDMPKTVNTKPAYGDLYFDEKITERLIDWIS